MTQRVISATLLLLCAAIPAMGADLQFSVGGAVEYDDNVTLDETIILTFSEDVQVTGMTFNNFHDGDKSLNGDIISIGGSNYTFTDGNSSTPSTYPGTIDLAANTELEVAYVQSAANVDDSNFYLHTLTFFAVNLAPGDPFSALENPKMQKEDLERLRRAWGYDQPIGTRFFVQLRKMFWADAEVITGVLLPVDGGSSTAARARTFG